MPRRNLQLAIFLFCLVASCEPAAERKQADSNMPPRIPDSAVARPDSGIIEVVGPTLVVFFRGAYAVADSGGDAAELLGDLQYYLGSARPALDSLGVSIVERYGDAIDYVVDGKVGHLTPERDRQRVGFLFLRPGAPMHVHYGLLTHLELVDSARARLMSPTRVRSERSGGRRT